MSSSPSYLHRDRLFPADEKIRGIARGIYDEIKNFPIISPHGHTDPSWFARNENFADAHALFIAPDHYLLRMLYSQGLSMAELGISSQDANLNHNLAEPKEAWRTFAKNFYLFRGTPTAQWFKHVFAEVFGIEDNFDEDSADAFYEGINTKLATEDFKPRALFESFNIEFLATTESPTDALEHHQSLAKDEWQGQVVTAYRPDNVVDPEHNDFFTSLIRFAELSGENVKSWKGYLNAHRKRREDFKALGATSTDHGHPDAHTENLNNVDAEKLFDKIMTGNFSTSEARAFRGQMLTEMARMSLDDGLTLQIHPGSTRNHNHWLMQNYGRDRGADIPHQVEYTHSLQALLNAVGNEKDLKIIVFTLDETTYSRELAPLAGHYPALFLGPAWWFHDSPEGMMRFREQATETAGFYNTVGFNDDTRAFLSIPARHDMARRVDSAFLARLVAEHRLLEVEAVDLAKDLTYALPKKAYSIQ